MIENRPFRFPGFLGILFKWETQHVGSPMFRRLLILACLSVHLAGSVAAWGFGLDEYYLTPGLIDPRLAFLDQEAPLGDRVKVPVSGKEPYDTFFRAAAQVQGTMVLTDVLTHQFGQALTSASQDAVDAANPGQWPELIEKVFESGDTSPEALDSLTDHGKRLEALLPVLLTLDEQVSRLSPQGKNLLSSARADFKGFTGAVKLAGVLKGLTDSVGQLVDAGRKAPTIVKNVSAIVQSVHVGETRPKEAREADPVVITGETSNSEGSPPPSEEQRDVPSTWRVAKVSGEKIYVNAGTNAGLIRGSTLTVEATGDTIRDPRDT